MCVPMNEIGVQFFQRHRAGRIQATEQSRLALEFKPLGTWSSSSGAEPTLAQLSRHALPTKGETQQSALAQDASATAGGA